MEAARRPPNHRISNGEATFLIKAEEFESKDCKKEEEKKRKRRREREEEKEKNIKKRR